MHSDFECYIYSSIRGKAKQRSQEKRRKAKLGTVAPGEEPAGVKAGVVTEVVAAESVVVVVKVAAAAVTTAAVEKAAAARVLEAAATVAAVCRGA